MTDVGWVDGREAAVGQVDSLSGESSFYPDDLSYTIGHRTSDARFTELSYFYIPAPDI